MRINKPKDSVLDIEQVFADVAGLSKEEHKNVLGDKWKYIKAVESEILPYIEQAAEFYRKPFAEFRRDIRNLLGKNGIPSNPGWTENDIIRGIEEAIKQAREQGIEEGWNQAEAHYQIDKG